MPHRTAICSRRRTRWKGLLSPARPGIIDASPPPHWVASSTGERGFGQQPKRRFAAARQFSLAIAFRIALISTAIAQ